MRFAFPLTICLFVLCLIAYSSCQNSQAVVPAVKDDVSKELDWYFRNNFGDSIPSDRHFFILVSKKSTLERIAEKMKTVKEIFNRTPSAEYSVYFSSSISIDDKLLPNCKFKTDWDGTIDKLNCLYSSVTLFKCENGKVVAKDDLMDQPLTYWSDFIK